MFRRVLLTTDGAPLSRVAVAHALRLVDGRDGRIRILHVAAAVPARDAIDMADPTARAEVDAIRRALADAGVREVEVRIAAGPPGEAIVAEAHAAGADVVAMATHGRSGLARTLMGSVADHVLRELRGVPVLLVRPAPDDVIRYAPDDWPTRPETQLGRADRPYRSVLVPLDGSDFAMSVLPTVVRAIDPATTEVDLVLVIDAAPETAESAGHDTPRGESPTAPATAPEARSSFGEREASAWLEEARRRLELARGRLVADGVRRVDAIVSEGMPEEAIVEYASRRAPELVVMATHGRSGLARTLLGSVPDHVLRHLPGRPILLLRPGVPADGD